MDSVILSGAAETEHHEIAVYEGLITEAQAMGKRDIVQLLRENLEQEKHTLTEVKGQPQDRQIRVLLREPGIVGGPARARIAGLEHAHVTLGRDPVHVGAQRDHVGTVRI